MHYYLGILITLVPLVLFVALVAYEGRIGRRIVFPGRRYHFDLQVSRIVFIARHVDWSAFLSDLTRTSLERLVHDVAHTTLLGVRFVERQLTLLVRTLRARRDEPILPASNPNQPSRLESAVTLVRKTVRRSRKQPKAVEAE